MPGSSEAAIKAWASRRTGGTATRIEKPTRLKQSHDRYFTNPPGSAEVPLSKVQMIRARPSGIEHAAVNMAKAAEGSGPKRAPISLRKLPGGKFEVVDGNSTVAVARRHGWTTIRGVLAKG